MEYPHASLVFSGIHTLGAFRRYINNSLRLARKYARIYVRGLICSEKQTVFREGNWRKTVSFEEQIMSKDKYSSMFLPQMEAIVFIILQIVFATQAVLKFGKYSTVIPGERVA